MITQDELIAAMQEASICHATADGLLIATDCLYPSNKVVQVQVAGARTFTVSDRSGAIDVLTTLGVRVPNPARTLGQFAEPHGLAVSNAGAIFISNVSFDMLPLAIVLVANASKEAAHSLLEKHRFSVTNEFRDELKLALKAEFKDRVRDSFRVVGASSKTHVFDHALRTDYGGLLLIDSAIDETNSMNSVIVSNIDVKLSKPSGVTQRIIYNDKTHWRAESLILLEEGAPVVAYTKMVPTIGKLLRERSEYASA